MDTYFECEAAAFCREFNAVALGSRQKTRDHPKEVTTRRAEAGGADFSLRIEYEDR